MVLVFKKSKNISNIQKIKVKLIVNECISQILLRLLTI